MKSARPPLYSLFTNPALAYTLLLLILAGLVACNMPSAGKVNGEASGTKAALDVQATIQAHQAQQYSQETQAAADATRIAGEVQKTMVDQQSTQLAEQSLQLAQQATQQAKAGEAQVAAAPPSNTAPPPTETPEPTEAPPTEVPPMPTQDPDALLKGAKVLLFEDMAGMYEVRFVRNALDTLGLKYTDLGDASGDFKSQLLSGTDWDLIISASESRSKVQGEFFVYLLDEINQGTAVVIEIWNLDDIGGGKFSSILTKCGLSFQSDWFNPKSPSLWWLAPESPVFHEPNEGMSLVNYLGYWIGDAGDLIRLSPGSDSVLLAGNIATEKQRYGTLAACMDGRVIIQTFSSHDYHQEDVERLWMNYIYNTLMAHFASDH